MVLPNLIGTCRLNTAPDPHGEGRRRPHSPVEPAMRPAERAIQRAVPRQWSGPPAVLPRVGPFEDLCGPPGRGGGTRTPPAPETRCRPPVGRCFRLGVRGRQGQCRGSIFVRDKTVAHRLSHRPATRVGRDGKTNLLNPFRPVFGKLVWLRFWAVEPTMAPNQRKCPPLGRFGWLRGGSGGHFQHF